MNGLLENPEGQTSTMRVMSFMALVAAIVYGYMDVAAGNTQPMVTIAFLLAAFCPKVLQSFVENKLNVTNTNDPTIVK